MKQTDTFNEELKTLSPLLWGLSKAPLYSVPPFYFDQLSKAIMLCIEQAHESATIHSIDQAAPPAGYFDNLSTVILNKIKDEQQQSAAEELATLSPLLQQLQSINVYHVPEGYFEAATAPILRDRPTKLVSMFAGNKIIRYAAAAVFIGAMGFTVFKKPPQPFRILGAHRFFYL